jgi:cyclopropane fatty-acyl-phospholipid synthase-like methyltransferase
MSRSTPREPESVTMGKRFKETMLLFSLIVTPGRGVRRLYEMYSTNNYVTESTLYLNNGYWRDSPKTLDEACQAMARLLGETANLCAQDEVLDVGFGYGDQDIYWMDQFRCKKIVGLNITPSQVELARKRVTERRLGDRIDLQLGSATEMPFEANTFDKVLALECAMHFVTRAKFFRDAHRVLRPGGRIATTDVIPLKELPPDMKGMKRFKVELVDHVARSLAATPSENLYPRDVYAEKMKAAGFENVSVTSIRNDVLIPFVHYLARRQHDREVMDRYNPLLRMMMRFIFKNAGKKSWDYVISVGDKPTS